MEKLKNVTVSIIADSRKDQVWDLLFNRFGEVNIFNPMIEGSHHTKGVQGEVGCERQCDVDSKISVIERIVAARQNDSFDIDIIEGGLPMMKTMKGTFDLKSIEPKRTEMTMTMRFSTKPAFMANFIKGKMNQMLSKMMIGLKYHLETDGVVTKENIKGIIKDYSRLDSNTAFSNKLEVEYRV
jgi:hypothetical protein